MYKEETEMKASFGIQLIRLTLFLCALTYLLKTLSLVKFFADPQDVVSGSPSFVNLASMVGGTLCINGLVVFFSMRGLAHIKQKRAETLKFIRRYMLWMFFIYPITNLLAGALYVPIYSAEGFEAYMLNSFDKFRYVWFASLYLVVIFDKRLKAYFIEVAEAPRNLLTRH